MNDHDQHLKKIILDETPPQLHSAFVEQTVRRLQLPVQKVQHLSGGSLALNEWVQSHKWWLMGAVLLMCTLALQHRVSLDEDLLHIDTLSMSTFSVL